MVSAPHPPLAHAVVNYVGEPFGVVMARDLETARRAAELVVT
jgi:CO/xanthine dehydrogenase Mo-binding subunit